MRKTEMIPRSFYGPVDLTNFAKSSGVLLRPTSLCVSPWSPRYQYGGNVACALYSALAAQLTGPKPMRCCQFNLHFFKPIPQQPLFLCAAPVLRAGAKCVHLQAVLMGSRSSGEPGEELARACGVFMREANLEASHGVTSTPNKRTLDLSKPEQPFMAKDGTPPRIGGTPIPHFATPGVGFFHALDARRIVGGKDGAPIKFWTKLEVPIFEGTSIDPLHRLLLVGEGSNGITAFLPLSRFSFVNPIASFTFLRPPRTEWICLRGRTEVSGEVGAGIVLGSLYDDSDHASPVATVSQTLLIEPWESLKKKPEEVKS